MAYYDHSYFRSDSLPSWRTPYREGERDNYPWGRRHSPVFTPVGMPRMQRRYPSQDSYFHFPTRSPSPPSFYTETHSYYDASHSRASRAPQAACHDYDEVDEYYDEYEDYDEYEAPPSPPRAFRPEKNSHYDTSRSRASRTREAAYDRYDSYSTPSTGSSRAEKGSYYDTPKAKASHSQSQSKPQSKHKSRPRPQPQPQPQARPQPQAQPNPQAKPQSRPQPRSQPVDTSPAFYTYEDEEPDRIPIAPMPWNNHRTSATKVELINFLTGQGIDPKRATAAIDREFAAHAPQHAVGFPGPALPRARMPRY